MAERVSILIPAFNAEPWIGEAIESAIDQTWPDKEIIVVDDGSKDRTLAIAKAYESRSVQVFNQDHAGPSAARNRALAFASGEWIQWLDADDVLAPDKIARQMERAGKGRDPRVLLSSAWAMFFNRTERNKPQPSPLWQDLEPVEWIYRKLLHGAWMTIESWLVSRELTETVGPWDESLAVDVDGEYFCRVVARSKKVVFVPEAKSYCRTGNFRSVASTANLTATKIESKLRSAASQIAVLRSLEDGPKTRTAGLACLQNLSIFLYPERLDLFGTARRLAAELGGDIIPPDMGWKYNGIRRIFGWRTAKRLRRAVRLGKTRLDKMWDREGDP
jgi:glycosyltransferase involved in cell wall biosynthesis